ncbi:MAG: DUF2235 domain-containing protein [Nitrospira sp.]|nr:DUF2235 domain-containing protein [Nitrospira sp.]
MHLPSLDIPVHQPPHSTNHEPPQETNVLRLYHSILPQAHDGRPQQKWYDSGTEIPWFDRFRSGSFGYGVDRTILYGYAYLAATYDPGDDLFIYGFSRGAYTARSLVGLLTTAGLIPVTLLNTDLVTRVREAASPPSTTTLLPTVLAQCLTEMILDPSNQALDEAYRLYRNGHSESHTGVIPTARRRGTQDVRITFLGLWDTVGPLGIPTNALKWLNDHRYNFHDTELSSIVNQAYHALAIDEHRADHNATLWTSPAGSGQTIEQRWFAGAHGDLGGTYPERDLADFSLAWLQRHSIETGLAIEPRTIPQSPNTLCPIHDSFSECLGGFRKWFHSRFYRPVMQTGTNTEVLDDSVHTRLIHTPHYRPKNEGLKSVLHFG